MNENDLKILLNTSSRLVGSRQVEKSISKGELRCVVVSFDADARIRERFIGLCKANNVEFIDGLSMKETGNLCGIEVGACAVGILKEPKTES
jgi:ribosomal protein L7Ae-like RNA K-turn-binding protein